MKCAIQKKCNNVWFVFFFQVFQFRFLMRFDMYAGFIVTSFFLMFHPYAIFSFLSLVALGLHYILQYIISKTQFRFFVFEHTGICVKFECIKCKRKIERKNGSVSLYRLQNCTFGRIS